MTGWLATFTDKKDLLKALQEIPGSEAITSYPVDEIIETYGPKVKVDWPRFAGLVGAVGALISVFWLQYYASVFSLPLNVGGRPLNSWPNFVPATFVLTILGTGVFAFLACFIRLKLPWPHHPLLAKVDLSTHALYLFVPVRAGLDAELTRRLQELGAVHVEEVPE